MTNALLSCVQALRRKVEILTFHKSNLAAEIEKLRAACNRRASHNSVLKMKLDVGCWSPLCTTPFLHHYYFSILLTSLLRSANGRLAGPTLPSY